MKERIHDNEAVFQECWERALRLLEQRAHAVAELRRKLRLRGYAPTVIDRVLSELERLELLDDREFAEQFCAYRLSGSRPLGQGRVLVELRRKGVAPEVAAAALEAFEEQADEDELTRAVAAARQKWVSLASREADPQKRRDKTLRFLAGRGFAAAICYQALEQLQQDR